MKCTQGSLLWPCDVLAAQSSSRSLIVGWSVGWSISKLWEKSELTYLPTYLPTLVKVVTVVTLATVVAVETVVTVATVATVVTVIKIVKKKLFQQKTVLTKNKSIFNKNDYQHKV